MYDNILYECNVASATGVWDGAKWERTTVSDVLGDKADVDGNYPTLTSGLADNLTPYSEDSGAEQENPFISNGTGTNNNTEIVTVGDYALFKEKQGHTLVVNQGIANTYNSPFAINNGIALSVSGGIEDDFLINGHTYLLVFNVDEEIDESVSNLNGLGFGYYNTSFVSQMLVYNLLENRSKGLRTRVFTPTTVANYRQLAFYNGTGVALKLSKCKFYDLTKFNFSQAELDDIIANPSHFSWYYNGSPDYNTGSLENANGVKLVNTGRNIWDEEWELGRIANATGGNSNTGFDIRSKNYIPVIPNTTLCYRNTNTLRVFFYDGNYNYLGQDFAYNVNAGYPTGKIPANARYMRFCTLTSSITTYNHDITISLYYTPEEGGEGYDKYYPYEEPYVVETGTEVLRQAGSVKDYKTPDGIIHRLVGVVDLGSLNWTYGEQSGGYRFTTGDISSLFKHPADAVTLGNGSCSKYTMAITYTASRGEQDKIIALGSNGNLYAVDSSYTDATAFKQAMSGVMLYYELATPTTEQGTQFAENLPINDYGMLYWLDSSNNLVGIPQGAKIFYPVNYKGFLDDVYARTGGDAQELVIQSELSADKSELQGVDTQLKNAIGGTLRQLLCVKESLDFDNTDVVDLGELTWSYVGNNAFSAINVGVKSVANDGVLKALSSKYQVVSYNTLNGDATKVCMCGYVGNDSRIYVRDTTYTDATIFKAAMKGVLLAYEKASS